MHSWLHLPDGSRGYFIQNFDQYEIYKVYGIRKFQIVNAPIFHYIQ